MNGPMIQPEYNPGPLFKMARATDPATSHRAAERAVASGMVAAHADIILGVVKSHPGINAAGIAVASGLHISQVNKRMCEIERAGLIRRTDDGGRYLRWWPKEAA